MPTDVRAIEVIEFADVFVWDLFGDVTSFPITLQGTSYKRPPLPSKLIEISISTTVGNPLQRPRPSSLCFPSHTCRDLPLAKEQRIPNRLDDEQTWGVGLRLHCSERALLRQFDPTYWNHGRVYITHGMAFLLRMEKDTGP